MYEPKIIFKGQELTNEEVTEIKNQMYAFNGYYIYKHVKNTEEEENYYTFTCDDNELDFNDYKEIGETFEERALNEYRGGYEEECAVLEYLGFIEEI